MLRRLALPAFAALLLVPCGAAHAAAAQCRASVARATLDKVLAEPVRANDGSAPCSRQSATAVAPSDAGPVRVDAAVASTDLAAGPTVGALARATATSASLPGLTVETGALSARAVGRCVGGRTVLEGGSSVTGLVVNGQRVLAPLDDAPLTLDVAPGVSVRLNESVVSGGQLTRRAVSVTALGASVVLGEATAGGDACAAAGSGGSSGVSSASSGAAGGICPRGSSYDPSAGECVIEQHSATNTSSHSVVVGRAFEGPSGGRVVELSTARAQLGAGAGCLTGAGPRYAIIGTNGRDSVTGTDAADRMVLRGGNDHVSGGRGDDCVYGGSGRDVLAGALGADRIIGGAGPDALDGGSGNDRLSGGSGRDTINTAYGRDTVRGGAGTDAINASTAGPASRRIDCGAGRDKVRINRNERRRVHGCETVYRIR